ncbi:MAG: NifU family protein [Rhodospirillaceae bacterium]
MFIQTEETPNPATLKFLPGLAVTGGAPVDCCSPEMAVGSPLARSLFAVDGVVAVFLGYDFITVTRRPDAEWMVLKPMLMGAIMDHFISGLPVLEAATADGHDLGGEGGEGYDGGDSEIILAIKDLLDQRVRPVVAQDGGDITFHSFENGVVYLNMRGACSGCPSSVATLKNGVENLLRHYIPEVVEVRAVR